jgi:hypothetical protein
MKRGDAAALLRFPLRTDEVIVNRSTSEDVSMKPKASFTMVGVVRKNRGRAEAVRAKAVRAPVFLAALLLLSAFGAVDARAAAEKDALAAMARFDRAYIPALSLSNQGKREQTEKAMARLQAEWGRFRGEYGSYGEERRWWEALRRVGEALSQAAMHLDVGDLPKTHEALEWVRDEFLRLREERSMDYYIDYLNRYHETMEEVLRAAGEAGAKGLDQTRKVRIAVLEGEARVKWEAVSAADFDSALFGFDGEKTNELEGAVAAVGKSLDALRAALCEKDNEAAVKAAQGLRPPYVKAFLMFGDFDGLE